MLHIKDVEITELLMQPYSCSPGDHRTIILDVTMLFMGGSYQHKIVYLPYQGLNMQHTTYVTRYMQWLKKQIDTHRIDEGLDKLKKKS